MQVYIGEMPELEGRRGQSFHWIFCVIEMDFGILIKLDMELVLNTRKLINADLVIVLKKNFGFRVQF